MIEDKYKQIEDFINNNEMALMAVIEVCDRLCDDKTNLKKRSHREKTVFTKQDIHSLLEQKT